MSNSDNLKKIIKVLEKQNERLSRLEKALFVSKQKIPIKNEPKYKGLMGGINLLIDNGFFKKPVLVTEVQDELKKEGYFYSLQATDTILRRDMVNRKKFLTRMKIDGVW